MPYVANPAQLAATDKPITKRQKMWAARIEESKVERRLRVPMWSENIDYRRGKVASSDDNECRSPIPFDWSATKSKQAQLFSQVPEVRLTPRRPAYLEGVPVFARKLNDTITRARVGTAMDECLPDVINASGVAGVIISYEARTQERSIPKQDPAVTALMGQSLPGGDTTGVEGSAPPQQPEMVSVPEKKSGRYTCTRISPSDLL